MCVHCCQPPATEGAVPSAQRPESHRGVGGMPPSQAGAAMKLLGVQAAP